MKLEKCPICGGEVLEKTVDKLLKGGSNSAIVTVKAEVCLHCGERMYAEETVRKFEDIRRKLEKKETGDFETVGKFYKAV